MTDTIRKLLIGDDVGLFPDEMETEFMVKFRMRDIAELKAERIDLAQRISKLLEENHRLSQDVAVKAEARRRTALWRLRHSEAWGEVKKYRSVLMNIAMTCSEKMALEIAADAFGVKPRTVKGWRRAVQEKEKRRSLHPSRRKKLTPS